jgi:membrane protease YdiL (CAAX protease family)
MRAFLIFFGLILGALVVGAVVAYPAWLLLHPHFDFAFHRIASRVGELVLLVGFLMIARRLGVSDRTSLGYGLRRPAFLHEMGKAILLGAVLMLPIIIFMVLLGLRQWPQGVVPSAAQFGSLIVHGLMTGLVVALIEETFMRGAMYTAIERESGARAAVVLTALVYSALHFFARVRIAPEDVTWTSGFDVLAQTLSAFASPLGIADAFLCLFGVGVLLGVIRRVTGNIAACIGLHAGWVWVLQIAREGTDANRTSPASFLISNFDGLVGWLMLAWTALMGLGLYRHYARRAG